MNHAQVENIFQRMEEMGAFKYTGGIPTRFLKAVIIYSRVLSMIENTGQQWDFPVKLPT
jgi:hypothetical protein